MATLETLWRGEEPLWRAYWIYGVLVNGLLFGVLGAVIVLMIDLRPLLVAYLAFLFVAGVFNIVSVWRSAGNHTGSKVWALLARAVCVLGALSLAKGLIDFVSAGA